MGLTFQPPSPLAYFASREINLGPVSVASRPRAPQGAGLRGYDLAGVNLRGF